MDLTKDYPRSVRAKWQGVVQLGRAVEKGKAVARGKVGEYHYQCSMDQAVFDFLGIHWAQLLERNRLAKSDSGNRSLHSVDGGRGVAGRRRWLKPRMARRAATARRVARRLSAAPQSDRPQS